MTFDEIDLLITNTLWIILIVLLLGAFSIFFYYKSYKAETSVQMQTFLAYGLFCTCFGVTRILFFLSEESFEYDIFLLLGYSVSYLGAIFLFFVLERHGLRNKTKYIFTIISCVSFLISVIFLIFINYLPSQIHRYFIYLTLPFLMLLIIVLYAWVAVKTTGEARSNSIGVAVAIAIVLVGAIIGSKIVADLQIVPLLTSPILVLVGTFLFVYFQRNIGS
jgi:hypothetical protein